MNSEFSFALVGGMAIGLAASGMLLFLGRIMGVSGILSALLNPIKGDSFWRVLFLLGTVFGGWVFMRLTDFTFEIPLNRGLSSVILGGLLVGFGTAMGSGCTSGHGVCGLSRLSLRSLVATLLFMSSGVLTVFVLGKLGG